MTEMPFKHILLADDDPDDRDFFAEAMHTVYPEVTLSMSRDGEELMQYLDNAGKPSEEVIFLDLNMPVMSGPECLQKIRSSKDLERSVVVVFTTSSNSGDIERMYKLGANYFISKPTDYNKLQRLIRSAIEKVIHTGYHQPAFDEFYITV